MSRKQNEEGFEIKIELEPERRTEMQREKEMEPSKERSGQNPQD